MPSIAHHSHGQKEPRADGQEEMKSTLDPGHGPHGGEFLSDTPIDLNAAPGFQCKVKEIASWESVSVVHQSFLSFPAALQQFAVSEPEAVCNAWLDKNCEVLQSFTRAQLWEYSGNVASMLVNDHHVQRGDRLMVVFPFGIEWIVSFLACLRIGAVVVSVYPPDPQRLARDLPKLAHFVEDSGSRVALTVTKYKQLVAATSLVRKWPAGMKWIATDPCFVSSGDPHKRARLESFDVTVQPDDVACIQYTSGSTSAPKGVMISHGNLFHQAHTLQRGTLAMADTPARNVRYVGWAPQYHDMGLFAVVVCLYSGTDTAYSLSPLDWLQRPACWPRAVQKYRGTFTCGPNFAFELTSKRLRESGERCDCSSLAVVYMGGEPTRLSTMQRAAAEMGIPFAALHNSWGLAEHCAGVSAFGHLALGETVGCSLAFCRACGIDVRVAVEGEGGELEEAAAGSLGELCVASPSVALGYWNQPELSGRSFRCGIRGLEGRRYLRTGDMGRVVGDEVFLLARLKDLIIINGRNVAPSDLEATAETAFSSQLRPGSSVAFQGEGEGIVLVCEMRKAAEGKVGVERLVREVQGAVEAEHGIGLDRVVLVEERALPKTTSGKVQRAKTAQLWRSGALGKVELAAAERRAGTGSLAVCQTLEEMLAALGVEEMGATLAESGVSSLEMTRLLHAADKTLGVQLDWRQLAECTAAQLCQAARAAAPARPPLTVCEDMDGEVLPGLWLRLLRQAAVLLACLLCIAAATLPPIAFVESCFDGGSAWWVESGRGGPLVCVAVVLWMATFSGVCVLAKWALAGRRQPQSFCVLWSNEFARWMLVERLLGTWEFAVGRFLLDTPWLNAFYSCMGADIGWDARLHTFFRDCDMVRVGRGTSVKGRLYGRVFTRTGMHFGRVEVGRAATVGAATVVQPFTRIGDGVAVEPCSVVPPHSALLEHGSAWHGNPCRQRVEATPRPEPHSTAGSDPLFATRLLFPPAFAALSAALVTLFNSRLADAEWGEPFSEKMLWMSTSYMCVFGLTVLGVLLLTLLLKWTFVSPWITDRLGFMLTTTFFRWCEKTFLVLGWHRAFGMTLGSGAVVIYSKLCSPSTAHLVSLGDHSIAFNGSVAPRDGPTVWSWLRGQTRSPWHAWWRNEKDVIIGKRGGLYAQSRVEGGAVLGDGVRCGGFARVRAGEQVADGETVVGDPSVRMHAAAEEGEPLGISWTAGCLHVLLTVLHVAWLAGTANVGLQLMLAIGKDGGGLGEMVYLRVPVRLLFGLGWLHVMLASEVVLAKWVLVGRAKPERFALGTCKGVCWLHMHALDCQMDGLLHTVSCGLALAEAYYWLLGFQVRPGQSFLNSSFLASTDADLVTICPGSIIDDDSYVLAHQATVGGYETSRAFVASGAVLHPQGGIFCGSVGEGASLYPRSKPLSTEHIPEYHTYIGAPAVRVRTRCADASLSAGSPSEGDTTHRTSSEGAPWQASGSLSFADPVSVSANPALGLGIGPVPQAAPPFLSLTTQ